jgi:hypothetical protein
MTSIVDKPLVGNLIFRIENEGDRIDKNGKFWCSKVYLRRYQSPAMLSLIYIKDEDEDAFFDELKNLLEKYKCM